VAAYSLDRVIARAYRVMNQDLTYSFPLNDYYV
jgi:hypothetical protein